MSELSEFEHKLPFWRRNNIVFKVLRMLIDMLLERFSNKTIYDYVIYVPSEIPYDYWRRADLEVELTRLRTLLSLDIDDIIAMPGQDRLERYEKRSMAKLLDSAKFLSGIESETQVEHTSINSFTQAAKVNWHDKDLNRAVLSLVDKINAIRFVYGQIRRYSKFTTEGKMRVLNLYRRQWNHEVSKGIRGNDPEEKRRIVTKLSLLYAGEFDDVSEDALVEAIQS